MDNELYLRLHLNAKYQPIHRFDLEDALEEILQREKMGIVDGGGTLQLPTGEIESCDINIVINNTPNNMEKICHILNGIGIPKGSEILGENIAIKIGLQEGLGLYINGTELSKQVYKSCDINYVIEKLNELLCGVGKMYSFWEGNQETALYFYGQSYSEMLKIITPFIEEYPLCEKCRIVRIA